MLKWIGAACVLGGGFLARWYGVSALRRQEETLEELTNLLERMLREIRMTRMPLPRLLARLAQEGRYTGDLFAAAAEAAGLGGDLEAVWRREAMALPLPAPARRMTAELAHGLPGDEEGICRAISLTSEGLSAQLARLRALRPDSEKRTTALCLSGAALLVILLI